MFRLVSCVCAVALLAVVAPAADEAIELKHYPPKVGDRTRVTDEERTTTRSIITVGEKREDKVERHTKQVVYVSEVLAVKKGEKKGTKIKRVYEKAEDVKDDTATKLPLHGKTVVIEKKGDKYTFTFDDGKAVDGEPREELDKEFNKKDEDAIDDFIPKRPLKPGETWKMDADKLVKALTKEKDAFTVDKKGASGTGKLAEVYTFGGSRYGVYDMRVELPLTELGGENKLALKAGSKMVMHIVGDGNVDGTEPDGVLTMRLTLRVFFEGVNGADGCVKADGIMTRAVEKLPVRPRD
jgi:hypothetical protein